MSSGRTAARAAERVGSGTGRVIRAWRCLSHERRLAAGSAIALFVTLFLPWYQETVIPTGTSRPGALPSASLTGWAAFSPVEAAVLLVAAGVLTLLFIRAEGRAFHVPGGDGGVITAAGFWTCVLIVWRIFDKQGTGSHKQFVTTSGIEWGIFVALVVAAAMAYTGNLIRAAHQAEPPLPGEEPLLKRDPDAGGHARRGAWTPRPVAADAPRRSREEKPAAWSDDAGRRRRSEGRPAEPVADDPPTRRLGSDDPPTRPMRTGSTDARERTQAPRPSPDAPPRQTQAARPRPDNAPNRPQARPRPNEAPKRPLPLDPVPVDEDWEIGEFRTQ
jgi:hypothetical protein